MRPSLLKHSPIPISNSEREFVEAAIQAGVRADGRKALDSRSVRLSVRRVSESNSLAEATIGNTRVMAIVSCELAEPYADRPNEGFFSVATEVMPCASPSGAHPLLNLVEKSLKESRAIDVEGLCVATGLYVWSIKCQLILLDDCGSAVDAASLACLAALLHFRRPDVSVADNVCTVHPIDEKTPLALAIHHIPLCISFAMLSDSLVVDPSHVEEGVAQSAFTVALNAHQEICSSYKTGAPWDREALLRAMQLAADLRATRGKLIDEAVLRDPF